MTLFSSVAVCQSEDVMKDVHRFEAVNDLLGSPIGIADQGEAPLQVCVCLNCGDPQKQKI